MNYSLKSSQLLKSETQNYHTKVEGQLKFINLFSDDFSEDNYVDLLVLHLDWLLYTKSRLQATDQIEPLLEVIALLRADLAGLEHQYDESYRHEHSGSVHPLGLLYVAYGSFLGGAAIYMFLEKSSIAATHRQYYNYCKSSGFKVFKELTSDIDQVATESAEFKDVLEAALHSFHVFEQIIIRRNKGA